MRKNWLTAVMVIAYKYPYGHDETLVGEKIVGLLRIVIHTLAAQSHVCDRYLWITDVIILAQFGQACSNMDKLEPICTNLNMFEQDIIF